MPTVRHPSPSAAASLLSPLLLELYALARNARFEEAALEAVRRHVPFDHAAWHSLKGRSESGPASASGAPANLLQDWECLGPVDSLTTEAASRPGMTLTVHFDNSGVACPPDLLRFARKWKLQCMLLAVWADPLLQVGFAIALFRRSGAKPFKENERRLQQSVMPHLAAARTMNALAQAEVGSAGTPSARERAVIDRYGEVVHADPGFAALLRTEFPEWRGPMLPAQLTRRLTDHSGESWRGEAILASRARQIGGALYLVNLRPLQGTDRLSARELAVAREFAAGRTHRQIAENFGISPATVRNQIQSVYAKLGVDSKVSLARHLGAE